MSRPAPAPAPESDNPFVVARDLAAPDMAAVDGMIRQRLHSDVVLINAIGEHIVGGGGKRLRPMLHVLAAHAAGYDGDAHIELAAVIEFIHTATLLHDDVVDGSALRRGRKTANAAWGNAASVLVGDFLYSRSFQMMVELDRMPVMRILADTTNSIAEGEVLQLLNIGKAETDEAAYMRVIERKTAVLFAAATELGGVLAGLPEESCAALRRYGTQLGCAFQIADDLLDYVSDTDTLGKNIGDDLAEGKPTLPLIYAIQRSTPMQAELLRNAITSQRLSALDVIVDAIRHSGALERTQARAQAHADAALEALAALPESEYRDALAGLAEYVCSSDLPAEREMLRSQTRRLAPFRTKYPGVSVEQAAVPGDAAGRLVDTSNSAALVVVGRHHPRRHIGSLMIGSVAHAVLQHAHGPVAVVPTLSELSESD